MYAIRETNASQHQHLNQNKLQQANETISIYIKKSFFEMDEMGEISAADDVRF